MQIAQTNQKTYVDNNLGGKSPYTYYYKVQNGGNVVAELSMDVALFGPNVKMYSPADDRAAIAAEIKNIDDQLFHDQFSEKRYAEVFKPGDYRDAGKFNIPYYVQIMGLGQIPTDVKIYNIECPPALDNNNATCNFWRAMENLSVLKNGDGNWLLWSVSQAAPMRRIYTDRFTDYDWRGEGWASGGFTADCYFADKVGTYSQQQWYTRNSHLDKGDISNGNGGWNIAYQGITLGNGVNANHFKDNWEGKAQGSTWGFVSGEENTPVIREKPFLFLGDDGRYKLFRPALRRNAVGPSWTLNNMGEGTTYDVVNDCFVAKPETPVATINAQLAAGKHVIFTPGLYVLNQPIRVTQPNTIVLGIGLPTLIPGEQNDNAALIVDDIDGATVAGFMFDTYYSSESLLKVGEITSHISHAANPTLLADCFFRIGGFANRKNNIDTCCFKVLIHFAVLARRTISTYNN